MEPLSSVLPEALGFLIINSFISFQRVTYVHFISILVIVNVNTHWFLGRCRDRTRGSRATLKIGGFPLTSYLHGWGDQGRQDTVGNNSTGLIKQRRGDEGPPICGKREGWHGVDQQLWPANSCRWWWSTDLPLQLPSITFIYKRCYSVFANKSTAGWFQSTCRAVCCSNRTVKVSRRWAEHKIGGYPKECTFKIKNGWRQREKSSQAAPSEPRPWWGLTVKVVHVNLKQFLHFMLISHLLEAWLSPFRRIKVWGPTPTHASVKGFLGSSLRGSF